MANDLSTAETVHTVSDARTASRWTVLFRLITLHTLVQFKVPYYFFQFFGNVFSSHRVRQPVSLVIFYIFTCVIPSFMNFVKFLRRYFQSSKSWAYIRTPLQMFYYFSTPTWLNCSWINRYTQIPSSKPLFRCSVKFSMKIFGARVSLLPPSLTVTHNRALHGPLPLQPCLPPRLFPSDSPSTSISTYTPPDLRHQTITAVHYLQRLQSTTLLLPLPPPSTCTLPPPSPPTGYSTLPPSGQFWCSATDLPTTTIYPLSLPALPSHVSFSQCGEFIWFSLISNLKKRSM